MSFMEEMVKFIRVRKKFWLLPGVFIMGLFVGLIILIQGFAVASFIYTLV